MLIDTVAGWTDEDFYSNRAHDGFDDKYDGHNFNPPNYGEQTRETGVLENIDKFFYLMVGGVFVCIVLVIIFKCCSKENYASTSTADGRRRSFYYQRSLSTVNGFDSRPTCLMTDVAAFNGVTQLDLPPSYDAASTDNSRYNSTQDLRDSDAVCSAPDDAAPPSYSDVCGTADTSASGGCDNNED
ncbi:hypothetical protein PPYR_03491 [Photinus pyralis]|uniref:Uncharacterized protein n=2 Tax=Photinus pyralis TaxID=7054 RepID=A0A1Y1MJI3_PHOPY|nr:uncharacterized protein LOC116161866 [Photinus pyralis]KAB0791691.1 hypothetical protein PPYR_03491 [Photinus pyralis]